MAVHAWLYTYSDKIYVGGNCDDKSAVWQIIDGVVVLHMTKWMNM